jgi:hypothetical protein
MLALTLPAQMISMIEPGLAIQPSISRPMSMNSMTSVSFYMIKHIRRRLWVWRLAATEDRKRVGVALFLILFVALIAVRPVFAVPPPGIKVIEVPYTICVIRLGIEQPDGTLVWLPGYAYPGTAISQCQNTTVYFTDVGGGTVAFHQFILNGTSTQIIGTIEVV